jgi:uncharacterized membrane protein
VRRLGLPAALALGAVNFAVQLGTRPLAGQERLSISQAAIPLRDVVSTLKVGELSPPAYFFGLHEWYFRIGHGAATLRFPSLLAGLLLIAATYWLGLRVAGELAASVAALLTAASPLVLEFAQLARPPIFAMLAATVAVAAALEADRSAGVTARRWIAASTLAGILAIATDYSAAFVVAPLALWLGLRRPLPRAARIGALAVVVYVGWLLALLASEQLERHNPLALPSSLTGSHFLRVLGNPFDGSFASLTGWTAAGAALLLVGVGTCLALGPPRRRLVACLALGAAAAVTLITLAGGSALNTRYTAVAAPLALVAIAAAAANTRRTGALLAAAAIACAAGGSALAHSKTSRGLRAGGGARPAASSSASPRSARAAAPTRL